MNICLSEILASKTSFTNSPSKMERFVISLFKICAEDGKIVVELFEPKIKFFPNFLTDTENHKRNFSYCFS